ncbi:MAG: ester cyclase [Chlamydiota bacterium]
MKKFAMAFMLVLVACSGFGNEPDLSYIFTPKGKSDPLAANKQIVSNFYHAMSTADTATIESLLAPKYQVRDSTVPFNSSYSQFDAFSKKIGVRLKALHQALPQLKLTVNQLIAEGNKVFASVQIAGVQRGHFLGAQPTDKPVNIHIFAVFTLSQGKITQIDEIWNQLEVMKQMGYIVL